MQNGDVDVPVAELVDAADLKSVLANGTGFNRAWIMVELLMVSKNDKMR